MSEVIKFELSLHFEPELEGTVRDLQKQIIAAINKNVDNVQDIEIACTWTGKEK